MAKVEKIEKEIEVVEVDDIEETKEANGLALASFVVGILAALTVWIGPLGLLLSVLATVFAAVGFVSNQTKNLAVAGFVLGVMSFIAALAFTIVMVVDLNQDTTQSAPSRTSQHMRPLFFDN